MEVCERERKSGNGGRCGEDKHKAESKGVGIAAGRAVSHKMKEAKQLENYSTHFMNEWVSFKWPNVWLVKGQERVQRERTSESVSEWERQVLCL